MPYELTGFRSLHDIHLDDLLRRLPQIGEDPNEINWIIREGIWTPHEHSKVHSVFPDLILVYQAYAVPVELKSSFAHRDHALDQLRAGYRFIREELDKPCPHGTLVVHGCTPYATRIHYDEVKRCP